VYIKSESFNFHLYNTVRKNVIPDYSAMSGMECIERDSSKPRSNTAQEQRAHGPVYAI